MVEGIAWAPMEINHMTSHPELKVVYQANSQSCDSNLLMPLE